MERKVPDDGEEIEDHLFDILGRLESGEDVDTSEFWAIVRKVKQDSALTDDLANLVGEVDAELFKRASFFQVPLLVGNLLEVLGLVLGLALVYAGLNPGLVPVTASTGVKTGALLVLGQLTLATVVHPLSHQAVGRLNGIQFSFYFLNGPAKIEPTIKTDYSTYIRAPARGRARMHIAGAVATNLASLLVLVFGYTAGAPVWSLVVMALVFLGGSANEFAPAILARLGNPTPFGVNMKKTDTYRYLREKKYA